MTRKVSRMAVTSSRSYREGELLHRLCRALEPKTVLELGTHLGLSTLYQATAVPHARFVTVEGVEVIADLARETWSHFGDAPLPEIELVRGNFDYVLPRLLADGLSPDYALLDGNHAYLPTLSYTRLLVDAMPPDSVIVLDDIYWSDGMKRAWDQIQRWPEVTVSVDLFHVGILFLKGIGPKEHVVLK